MHVDIESLLNLEVTILFLMAAGYIMTRWGIINDNGRRTLTDLVIDFILPCNIIESFVIKLDIHIINACMAIFVVSVGIQLLAVVVGKFFYPNCDTKEKAVLKYATMVSNAGFMGNPVVLGLYGTKGLLYASIYLIPQRILMWSYGITCFTNKPDKKGVAKKLITHPCIIAVIIGMILMITQIKIPEVIMTPISTAGKCTTALSMIVIGSILSGVKIREIISKKTVWFTIVRLLAFPGIVLVCCLMLKIDSLVIQVATVLSGMPAATTTALLADKYDGADEKFAVKIVFLSTIMSVITIPLLCIVMGVVMK